MVFSAPRRGEFGSAQDLAVDGELAENIAQDLCSGARAGGHGDVPVVEGERRGGVLGEGAGGGGGVAGEGEGLQGGQGQGGWGAYPGFQHAAAPDGDAVCGAQVVDGAGREVAADPGRFDVDHRAGCQPQRGGRRARGGDGLIQAEGGGQQPGEFGVAEQVVGG